MKSLALLIGLAACVSPLSGQQPEQKSKTVISCDESAGCAHQFVNGRKVKTITVEGITVSASLFDTGKYFRVDLAILNTSAANFDVLPAMFSITETAPKEKIFAYVDVGKIISSAQNRTAWANAFAAAGAGMQRQQTTTNATSYGTVNVNSSDGTYANGSYNGSSTSTTSAPDYAAQARANEAIRQRNSVLAVQSSQLSDAALRSNTVLPGQNVSGCVFFERKGKAKSVVLAVPIGDRILQFPFEFHR
jgi:hypothetical protein